MPAFHSQRLNFFFPCHCLKCTLTSSDLPQSLMSLLTFFLLLPVVFYKFLPFICYLLISSLSTPSNASLHPLLTFFIRLFHLSHPSIIDLGTYRYTRRLGRAYLVAATPAPSITGARYHLGLNYQPRQLSASPRRLTRPASDNLGHHSPAALAGRISGVVKAGKSRQGNEGVRERSQGSKAGTREG